MFFSNAMIEDPGEVQRLSEISALILKNFNNDMIKMIWENYNPVLNEFIDEEKQAFLLKQLLR